MEYTLITKTGTVMRFFIKDVADMYQTIYGGVVFSQQSLDAQTVDTTTETAV